DCSCTDSDGQGTCSVLHRDRHARLRGIPAVAAEEDVDRHVPVTMLDHCCQPTRATPCTPIHALHHVVLLSRCQRHCCVAAAALCPVSLSLGSLHGAST